MVLSSVLDKGSVDLKVLVCLNKLYSEIQPLLAVKRERYTSLVFLYLVFCISVFVFCISVFVFFVLYFCISVFVAPTHQTKRQKLSEFQTNDIVPPLITIMHHSGLGLIWFVVEKPYFCSHLLLIAVPEVLIEIYTVGEVSTRCYFFRRGVNLHSIQLRTASNLNI